MAVTKIHAERRTPKEFDVVAWKEHPKSKQAVLKIICCAAVKTDRPRRATHLRVIPFIATWRPDKFAPKKGVPLLANLGRVFKIKKNEV
jgi:hypothetical protein